MEPEDLPGADDLWWSWVVLAALHRATGDRSCRLDADELVLALDHPDGGWLRMRRTHGSRAVLWGRSVLAPDHHRDAARDAPEWTHLEDRADQAPSFLAWSAHGEWDASDAVDDEGAVHLLRPLLTVDPRLVELARHGKLTAGELAPYANGEHLEAAADLVTAAGVDPPRSWTGSVRARLRDQIHDQMREACDRDRQLMRRPPVLVQWSRVNGPGMPFEHAVMAVRHRFRPAPTNTRLPEPVQRSLTTVLRTLHHDEASDDAGAWLFARVRSDGVVITLDRAFDSWPWWYRTTHVSQGPTLDDLAWEMAQRDTSWRPAWATLLPAS